MPNDSPTISREERITSLLVGAIDLHCHSGPSVMPRELDHIEALQDAASAGMRAMLIKDHYYSATPVTELLNKHYGHLGVTLLSGVPLNNALGGFNLYAVDHGIALGARLVWMPTFTAKNHIDANAKSKGFPHTTKPLIEPEPLTVLDGQGQLIEAVKPILDHIAMHDVVLSGGHLHITEIFPLFEEAKRRGVKRLLVNHPTFLIGCTYDDIRALVEMGAYIEHSFCMFINVERGKPPRFPPEELDALIKAGTVERTILGSDLGQRGRDRPVEGFRSVIEQCLNLGYSDSDIRRMISLNAAELIGLDKLEPGAPAEPHTH
ncbi:MAG: hypothetical protein EPO51_19340 [Phenylobacterium sp.]|uniref:DUF6282 family protein n=1 Tax=Phenylobacterium sp. TaxID=1871053 RepID=UPI0012285349|nr:DUF6282 family protein [Phenylobacterium sp.]TAJ70247.1 MAG: hypothetical protein EPO51_19340 [Phenylobacterium sp.]